MQRFAWILLAAVLALAAALDAQTARAQNDLSKLDVDGAIGMMQSTMADRNDQWKCTLSAEFVCKPTGCTQVQPSVWIELDFPAHRYSRCDAKGCDHYDFQLSRSGMFTILALPKNAALLKSANDGSQFVEIMGGGESAYNGFGSCHPK